MWPFDVLFERLREALADGVLDADEEAELMGLLLDYTGGGTMVGGEDTSALAIHPRCRYATLSPRSSLWMLNSC